MVPANLITNGKFILINLIGDGIMMAIFKLMLPPTLKFFSFMELFFVNDIGLPFNSGTIASFLVIACAFYFAISYTSKEILLQEIPLYYVFFLFS